MSNLLSSLSLEKDYKTVFTYLLYLIKSCVCSRVRLTENCMLMMATALITGMANI